MKWLVAASFCACLCLAASAPALAGAVLPPLDTSQCNSLNTAAECAIQFTNNSGVPVDVYWLNGAGTEIFYYTLSPGQTVTQLTWLTHPWIVRRNSDSVQLEGFQPQTASPWATPDPDIANINGETGPFPNACEPVPTETVTWGLLKSRYVQ